VGLAGQVQELAGAGGFDAAEAGDVHQQVDDVAGVDAAEVAALGAVVALDDVAAGGVLVGDAVVAADHAHDAQERFLVRVADLDLVADAAEEGLVAELTRWDVRGEDEQELEGDLHGLAAEQGEEV